MISQVDILYLLSVYKAIAFLKSTHLVNFKDARYLISFLKCYLIHIKDCIYLILIVRFIFKIRLIFYLNCLFLLVYLLTTHLVFKFHISSGQLNLNRFLVFKCTFVVQSLLNFCFYNSQSYFLIHGIVF